MLAGFFFCVAGSRQSGALPRAPGVTALGCADALAGFPESRWRLGSDVDRLVPGFLLGCPRHSDDGSIASTGIPGTSLCYPTLALSAQDALTGLFSFPSAQDGRPVPVRCWHPGLVLALLPMENE
jgi:hypothetical protein